MPHQPIPATVYDDLQAQIALIEQDQTLTEASNFVAREAARRMLEQQVVDELERLMEDADKGEKKRLRAVKRQALSLRSSFEQANEQLWAAFRAQIKAGHYTAHEVVQRFSGYVEPVSSEVWDDPPRYDHLDTFVDGILQVALLPRAQHQPDPEMVLYQPTPARIVLDLLQRLQLGPNDVFYDLGSGLGRVTIIAALASEAYVRGVEVEPAYVAYAQRRVKELALPRIEFVNADARDLPYSDGTVFFLYTPFKGKILQRVLELLRYEARHRHIRVCTYGPGTLDVMEQDWLHSANDSVPDIHRAAIFESR